MTAKDRLVIVWHCLRRHDSAFTHAGRRWFCQCGEARGSRVIA